MADDDIWRDVHTRSQRHPVTPYAHSGGGGGGGGGGGWRGAYEAGLRTDGNWRRRRCVRSEHAHHEAYINHVHKWGDRVLTASADHTLCLWALQPRCTPPHQSDPDQQPRAEASLRRRDGSQGAETTTMTPDASSSAAGDNGGGNGSAVAQAGHEATPIRRFVGHIDHVTSVTTVQEHTRVLSAAADGQLIVWDVVTGDAMQSRRVVRHAGSLSAAAQEREVPSPHLRFLDSHPRGCYVPRSHHRGAFFTRLVGGRRRCWWAPSMRITRRCSCASSPRCVPRGSWTGTARWRRCMTWPWSLTRRCARLYVPQITPRVVSA
jgi:WD40 repeat protein